MSKIKKIRNIVIIVILFLISAFLGLVIYKGLSMKASLFGVYDVEKEYMYEPSGADITVLDFNQYGCDMCRSIHPIFMEAMAKDGRVRYIPRAVMTNKEFEKTIVYAVYAAASQDKFIKMHNAIYDNWPVSTHSKLMSIAEQLGLDTAQLQADMDSEKVKQKIQETEDYFIAWKLPGVPAFFIDRKILYIPKRSEMPTVDTWLEKFDRVRQR